MHCFVFFVLLSSCTAQHAPTFVRALLPTSTFTNAPSIEPCSYLLCKCESKVFTSFICCVQMNHFWVKCRRLVYTVQESEITCTLFVCICTIVFLYSFVLLLKYLCSIESSRVVSWFARQGYTSNWWAAKKTAKLVVHYPVV